MDELEGDKKSFYEDQKNEQVGRLDTAIDKQYEQDQVGLHEPLQVELTREQIQQIQLANLFSVLIFIKWLFIAFELVHFASNIEEFIVLQFP